jgi:integrase
LATSSPWLREFIIFALNIGMRQGEILNLEWQDVDFVRDTLVVMKSKNGTRRTIPLNVTVYELLATKQAITGASRGLVFKTPRGNELKVRFLGREFCHMTQRYAHHSPESARDGVKVLDVSSAAGTILTQPAKRRDGEVSNYLI